MSVFDEAYEELSAVPVDEWPMWLDVHDVAFSMFHWWLALLERLETDLSRLAGGPAQEFTEVCDFVVKVLEFAVSSGAWRPSYAGGMLCRLSRMVAQSPVADSATVPDALTIDGAARRTLDSFELSADEALDVALRVEADDSSRPPEREWRLVQDIQWALPYLREISDKIRANGIADEVMQWLVVEAQLSRMA